MTLREMTPKTGRGSPSYVEDMPSDFLCIQNIQEKNYAGSSLPSKKSDVRGLCEAQYIHRSDNSQDKTAGRHKHTQIEQGHRLNERSNRAQILLTTRSKKRKRTSIEREDVQEISTTQVRYAKVVDKKQIIARATSIIKSDEKEIYNVLCCKHKILEREAL